MKLFPSLFKKNKTSTDHAIALDIGTEIVKALIFRISRDKEKGIVVGVGRSPQQLGDMQSGTVTDISGVVSTCQKAISEAEKMAGGLSVQQAVIGIAGELVKGSTITIHYERLKPEAKIDLAELKNIVQKVQKKAFDKARAEISWESGWSEIDIRLINAAIVDVKIDGYRVTNPLGFQGKDVSISVFNAYAPLIHLGALQTIASDLGLDLLSIAAEPYAIARCFGMEDQTEFSAIFMDVGGGTTDIAIVKSGGLEGIKMFALGGRVFTKRISQELGVSFKEAEEMKIKYSKKKLPAVESQKIAKILEKDCQIWLSGVELALGEFSKIELLPTRILLCGGGSKLPEIQKALKESDWMKSLPFTRRPSVDFIKPQDVSNIIDETKTLNDPQDITPMGLANLALDLAGEEKLLAKILRKVVRMMQT